MRETRADHSLPTLVTLLVIGFLLMTFDIRAQGEGVLGTVRNGVSTLVAPLQKATGFVVDPMADFIENVSNLRSLRSENDALRAEVARLQADQAVVQDKIDLLDQLLRVNDLTLPDELGVASTKALVIGRSDNFDLNFRIDKGEEAGILKGNPVLDENGYLVGRVLDSWQGGAIVVPITGDVDAVTVTVGENIGSLRALIGSGGDMVLDVFDSATPVVAGERVVTSAQSFAFPPSIPVGSVVDDVVPTGKALTAMVHPDANLDRLRVVVVLAWPVDPASAVADDTPPTPTTVPGSTVPGTTVP